MRNETPEPVHRTFQVIGSVIVSYMPTRGTIMASAVPTVGAVDGIGDALRSYWTDGDALGHCSTPYDAPPWGYIRMPPTDTGFGASTETHGD